MTIQEALDHAFDWIDRLDAQLLLAHVLSRPRSFVLTWPEHELSDAESVYFNELVQKRSEDYPIAYMTGTKHFWNMELRVNPDVLIPRPETELLVELALSKLPLDACVLELATGSGAIASALAHERPDLQITATDISQNALKVARANAHHYHLTQIEFICSNWFTDIPPQAFDLIVCNPPYLSASDSYLSTGIRFEPRSALVSGENGDEDFIAILTQAARYLKPGGWILFEHGAQQGARVRALLDEQGYIDIFTERDLAGLERVSGGKISPAMGAYV